MYTNEDLLSFFDSLMGLEKNQCYVANALADEVDEPTVKDTLLRIGHDEQRHMEIVQKMLDLVSIEKL